MEEIILVITINKQSLNSILTIESVREKNSIYHLAIPDIGISFNFIKPTFDEPLQFVSPAGSKAEEIEALKEMEIRYPFNYSPNGEIE